jgi:hypothetical protein
MKLSYKYLASALSSAAIYLVMVTPLTEPSHRSKPPSRPLQLAQASNVCRTPYGACILPGYAPVGSPCWCASQNGPIQGRVG